MGDWPQHEIPRIILSFALRASLRMVRTKYLDCLRGARKEEEVITTDHSFKLAEAN
jgi:hypothetical protein